MAGHSRSKNGVASARLCPAIHVLSLLKESKTWMPATSAGMTGRKSAHLDLTGRLPAFDRVLRIVVAGRRRGTCDNEPVDQGFVLGGKTIVERADVVVPLFFGARAGDDAGDKGRVEHPADRKLARGDAARLRMLADLLRQLQRL